MSNVWENLKRLNLTLPPTPKPVAAYIPAQRIGHFVYTSGQLPTWEGELRFQGKVGNEVSLEEAYEAAKLCALNGLAAAASVVDLDRIVQVVKVLGFVNSAPGFHLQPKVVNGASELLLELFGENGRHARSAIGCSELPSNAPVEVEFIFAVEE